jgi:hypothetical protein
MHQAVLRAAAEQAARPPFEETETFKQKCGEVRALLADVPPATRQALHQARARVTEVEAALAGVETEHSRIQVARTLDSGELDRWTKDTATVDQRKQALAAAHAQATKGVERATQAVLTAMLDAAERRRVTLAADADKARAAVHEAQAAFHAIHEAGKAVALLGQRIRDVGLADQYVAYVFHGEELCSNQSK